MGNFGDQTAVEEKENSLFKFRAVVGCTKTHQPLQCHIIVRIMDHVTDSLPEFYGKCLKDLES